VLLGSSATGSGAAPSQITLGTNLSMSGSTLNASGGGGGVTSITATSPIVVTPTPLVSTGVISLNAGVDLALTVAQTETVTDAATSTITDVLTLTHNSSGAGAAGYGTGLLFQGKSDTTNSRIMGNVGVMWKTPTDGTRSSILRLRAAGSGGLDASGVYIFNGGGVNLGTNTDPGSNTINSGGGYKAQGTSPASGIFLQSNGGAHVDSSYKLPTTGGGTGKIMQSDGTNFLISTPAFPTAAGTSGYTIRSDGTNFGSYPQDMLNASTSSQSPSTSDVYLTGSNVTVAAGDFKAKGQYRCLFDVTKTAGTGAIVLSVRVGTAGAIGDSQVLTFTFGAGTSVADTGIFEVIVTWRTVGSGTSAVVQGICRAEHNLATTGLFNNAAAWTIVATTSSGFASNLATNMGVSFNGSTAFAGTITLVQATLLQ
jgi:hypothetical protein